ncbi:hypothetical protein EDD86DRAFT_263921 [Gorgonomyces haynaldii]|nr:hypothetical protein EDD86DRAFT_263921 [Gorgonomyces haynaldii]
MQSNADAEDVLTEMGGTELRNYVPRTYSGADLLHGTPTLPKKTLTFPNLYKLDLKDISDGIPASTEMKLMDIIMGDDMLKEGLRDLDQVKKNLDKDIKTALKISGTKKMMLRNRCDIITSTFSDNLLRYANQANEQTKTAVTDFKFEWNSISQEITKWSALITTAQVGEIDKATYEEALEAVYSDNQKRLRLINRLESTLEEIEHERASKASEQMTTVSRMLKSLNFQHPLTIEKLIQHECSKVNTAIIRNREAIVRYTTALRAVVIDATEHLSEYYDKFGLDWNQIRYNFTFSSYSDEIQKLLDVNVGEMLERYCQKFEGVVELQEDAIFSLVSFTPNEADHTWMNDWRKQMNGHNEAMEVLIVEVQTKLDEMERTMDTSVNKCFDHWYPLIKESCKPDVPNSDPAKIMRQEIEQYRKTAQFVDGKTSIISLRSKVSRNHTITSKVEEFVLCVTALKMGVLMPKLQEQEVQIVNRMAELKQEFDNTRQVHERNFNKELQAIKTETRDTSIHKRVVKCHELIRQINECDAESLKQCIEWVKSIAEKSKTIYNQYVEKIDAMFSTVVDDPRKRNDRPDSPTKEPESTEEQRPETPAPMLMTIVDPRLNPHQEPVKLKDHEFFIRKIIDWRQEQQQLQKQKQQQLQIEKIKQEQEAQKQKKEKQKKEVAREPQLLDGSLPSQFDSPLQLMEKWGYPQSTPHGYILDSDMDPKIREVVDIRNISVRCLRNARIALQLRFQEEAKKYWNELLTNLQKSINVRSLELANEKHTRAMESDRMAIQVEEAAKKRIEELPKLRVSHENEASVLVYETIKLKNEYASELSQVLSKATKFLADIKKMEQKLGDASSSENMLRMRKEFDLHSRNHGHEIKTSLSKTVHDFEHRKRVLFRSREPGHHAAAWHIIDEADTLGKESLAAELEIWREPLDAQIDNVFADTKSQLSNLSSEFEYHVQDMLFIEECNHFRSHLRLSLKAEDTQSKKRVQDLTHSVQKLSDQMEFTQDWEGFMNLFMDFERVRQDLVNCCKCLKTKPKTKKSAKSDTIKEEADHKTDGFQHLLYYEQLQGRSIRKKNEIPPQKQPFLVTVDAEMALFRKKASDSEKAHSIAIAQLLEVYNDHLDATIHKFFGCLTKQCTDALQDQWKSIASAYLKQRTAILTQKRELSNQLKPVLGHPRLQNELSKVQQQALTNNQTFVSVIGETDAKCKQLLKETALEFVGKLDFATAMLGKAIPVVKRSVDEIAMDQIKRTQRPFSSNVDVVRLSAAPRKRSAKSRTDSASSRPTSRYTRFQTLLAQFEGLEPIQTMNGTKINLRITAGSQIFRNAKGTESIP